LPLSVALAGLAVLVVLSQVVLNPAEAGLPHRVFRNVGEILVWVEKTEDNSEGGLIEVQTIRANVAMLLTELLEDSRPGISIRQDQSPGLPFPAEPA
jgi:hypothetical protein